MILGRTRRCDGAAYPTRRLGCFRQIVIRDLAAELVLVNGIALLFSGLLAMLPILEHLSDLIGSWFLNRLYA